LHHVVLELPCDTHPVPVNNSRKWACYTWTAFINYKSNKLKSWTKQVAVKSNKLPKICAETWN